MRAQTLGHITAHARDARNAFERFTIPLRALIQAGTATGNVVTATAPFVPVVPGSTIVLHASLGLAPSIKNAAQSAGCRIVYDIDDDFARLLRDLPRHADVARRLEDADGLTASSESAAAVTRGCASAARVFPSVMDCGDWSVQPRRAARGRPRIGWYGRAFHCANAPLIAQIVEAVDDADFFLFGDLPPQLAGLGSRVTHVVPIPFGLFPAVFAAYDLDLVLVPPSVDPGNATPCDSALLHAGMLSYPVIVSDGETHAALPIARVANTQGAWVQALRERLDDPARRKRDGAALSQAVHAHFTIDRWADVYAAAWLPRASAPSGV